MKKKVFGRKLSRSRPAREALFASLARSIILNGKIETTRAKAKAVIGSLEKMVTDAKKGGLSGQRRILADLDNKREALTALYERVVPAFPQRTSGYIRLISLPPRKGDNAQMVRMEWTDKPVEIKKEEPKAKKVTKKVEKKETKKEVKKSETKPEKTEKPKKK